MKILTDLKLYNVLSTRLVGCQILNAIDLKKYYKYVYLTTTTIIIIISVLNLLIINTSNLYKLNEINTNENLLMRII